MAWMHCDAMVKGWLTTAMEKDIRSSVKYANTASEIWSDLLERKKEKLYQFLMGLDTEFAVIKTEILAMNPIPTLGNVYHLVAEKERQRPISGVKKAPPESAAFKAYKPVRRENNVSQNKTVPKYQKRGDTEEKYTKCGRSGHTRDGCFKINGYPDWWPGKVKPRATHVETEASPVPGLTKEQCHSFLKHFAKNDVKDGSVRMANMAGKRDWDSDWVVDSGSTEHITPDETIFDNNFFCSNEEPVVIPNGDAIHKLYTRSLIGAGKCRKGLYRKGLLNGERRTMMTTRNTWHKRLGHASEDKLVVIDFLKSITLDKLCDFVLRPNILGILLETICPHTPQQNKVIERKHRHIEVARSLRFEANLPKRFWGECILTATYITNRLPSKVIDDKTPFELVFNQKLDYDNMRVFGCLTYHRNTDTRGDKFEERGRPRVFMSYPQRTKGYKILDIKTSKIIISRDTKFFEEKFPFKSDDLIYEEVDALEPFNKPICDEIKNHVKPTVDEVHIDESTSSVETNRNSMVNDPSESDGTNNVDEHNVNPTLNENEAEDILSETLVQSRTTEGNEAQPDIPEELTRVKRNRSQPARLSDYHVKLPPSVNHAKPASSKASSTVERFKARLVTKGFIQMEGVDYHDTFALVAKLVTVRTLLAVVVKKEWVINQLDVNNAFLHGDLNEEVYMKLPQGFATENDTRVCRLNKSLYGLKQASQNWYQKFTSSLLELGFKQCKADYSLFIFKKDTCLGALKYFLGIEVARTSEGLVLSQRKYILDILEDCGFQGFCLLYLQATRPDIAYSVNVLRQFIVDPRHSHMDAAHQVLWYLKGTVGQGILLPQDGGCNLTAYFDYDWLGCPITRRSRTGYLLFFGGAPISWKTKKQNVVSRSSVKAEYRSMASTVREILWMWWLLKELSIVMTGPTLLFCNNQAARHIANNPVFHERTKHVEMDFYFVRERVESQEI
ncbi:integrase [Tanacetum coccineum]